MAIDIPTQIPANERESLEAFKTYLDLLPPGPWVSDHWNQTVNGPVGPAYAIMDAMGRGLASSTVNIVMRRNGAGDQADEDAEYTGVQRAMHTAGAQESDEEWEPVPSNDPIRELFEYPNEQDSIGDILYKHWFQWALTGSCFEWCPPNGFDEPSRIFNIPTVLTFALPVTPTYPAGAWRVMPQTSLGAYAVIPGNSSAMGAIIPAEEMVVHRNPHPWVAYDGYSKFQAAATQLDVVKQIDLMRSSAAQNGVEPSLVIIAPPGTGNDVALQLENKINGRYSGPYSFRKVMVLSGAAKGTDGMQVMPWSKGPNEVGGFETWEQMVGFLSALWGVPRAVSGLVDASSYAQLFAALKQFHTLALVPFANQIARVWSKHILWPTWGRNYRIQIDVPAIDDRDSLRADLDLLGKYRAVKVNEMRTKLGFPKLPGAQGEAMVGDAAAKEQMDLEKEKAKNAPQSVPGKGGPDNDRPENEDGEGSLPNRIAPHMNGVVKASTHQFREDDHPRDEEGQFTTLVHTSQHELPEGVPTKPDANGLVWYFPKGEEYGSYGEHKYELKFPKDKILDTNDSDVLAKIMKALPRGKGRTKSSDHAFAVKNGYLAMKRGSEVAMLPEVAKKVKQQEKESEAPIALRASMNGDGSILRSKDAQGHEHAPSGPGGGQFTSTGGSGNGKKTPSSKRTAAKKTQESKKEDEPVKSHKDAYQEAREKVKEVRRQAYKEAKASASEHRESAGKAMEAAKDAGQNLSWDSGLPDFFEAYDNLDAQLVGLNNDDPPSTRFEELGHVIDYAKEAIEIKAPTDDDYSEDTPEDERITAKDLEANIPHLKAIIANAKAARQAIRDYAAARRDMQAINENRWDDVKRAAIDGDDSVLRAMDASLSDGDYALNGRQHVES